MFERLTGAKNAAIINSFSKLLMPIMGKNQLQHKHEDNETPILVLSFIDNIYLCLCLNLG